MDEFRSPKLLSTSFPLLGQPWNMLLRKFVICYRWMGQVRIRTDPVISKQHPTSDIRTSTRRRKETTIRSKLPNWQYDDMHVLNKLSTLQRRYRQRLELWSTVSYPKFPQTTYLVTVIPAHSPVRHTSVSPHLQPLRNNVINSLELFT